jgi:hypothetical protein
VACTSTVSPGAIGPEAAGTITIRCTTASGETGALPGEGGGSGGGGGGKWEAAGEAAAAVRPVDAAVVVEVVVDGSEAPVVVSVSVTVVEVEVVVVDWVVVRVEVALVVVELVVQEPPTGTGPTHTSEAWSRVIATADTRTRRRAVRRTSNDADSRRAITGTPGAGAPASCEEGSCSCDYHPSITSRT